MNDEKPRHKLEFQQAQTIARNLHRSRANGNGSVRPDYDWSGRQVPSKHSDNRRRRVYRRATRLMAPLAAWKFSVIGGLVGLAASVAVYWI
jgi:hypothetical protein